MKMQVKLSVDHADYGKRGTIIEVEDARGNALIAQGMAGRVADSAILPPEPEPQTHARVIDTNPKANTKGEGDADKAGNSRRKRSSD